jgi:hypothetical protein
MASLGAAGPRARAEVRSSPHRTVRASAGVTMTRDRATGALTGRVLPHAEGAEMA